jgi:NAD(P)-dependent dehydrogenase (short-subunit alcohol dehydrogenase family)
MASTTTTARPAPWSRVEGQVVLVTGASSGIGRDFCLDLARAGCRVVAAARRTDRLRSLCEEINSSESAEGPRAIAVELDVSTGGSTLEAAVQRAWDAFGRVDALINNAGIRGTSFCSLEFNLIIARKEIQFDHAFGALPIN